MIRGFAQGDLAALHRLDQLCFPPDIAYSKAQLLHFLNHPGCSCWIVQEDAIAAFLIVERASRRRGVSGHIVTLDVDPASRRRGLGRLLLECAEEQMKQEGIGLMTLEVAENNAAARHFYRSLGYVNGGRIAKYYGGKIDAELMQKVIAPRAL